MWYKLVSSKAEYLPFFLNLSITVPFEPRSDHTFFINSLLPIFFFFVSCDIVSLGQQFLRMLVDYGGKRACDQSELATLNKVKQISLMSIWNACSVSVHTVSLYERTEVALFPKLISARSFFLENIFPDWCFWEHTLKSKPNLLIWMWFVLSFIVYL